MIEEERSLYLHQWRGHLNIIQDGPFGHGLYFGDNLVKYSTGWLADTVAVQLPSGDTGISNSIVNKRKSTTTRATL